MSRRIPPRRNGAQRQTVPAPTEINGLMALYHARQWQRLEVEARGMVARCPTHPSGWTFLGLALQGLGRLPEAVAALAQAVRFAPQDAGTHGNLGAAFKALGRHAEAEASYRKALALQPNHAGLHYNLGNLLRDSGNFAEAEVSYRRALDIRPGYVEAHNNLGNVLKGLGHFPEAEACYRRALAIQPDSAETHNNLANLFLNRNRFLDAEACYRRTLQIRPGFAEAHCGLGSVLLGLGRFSDAEACYRQALAIQPDSAETHNNLANLFLNRYRFLDAEIYYRRALQIRPDFAEAHCGMGNALLGLGRFSEAEACYRKTLALRPDYIGAQDNLLFSLNYQERPAGLRRDEALEYGLLVSAKVRARFSAWSCTERPNRLRVGIVSGDLWRHPAGYFLEGVLTHLDPARIELFAYTTVAREDDLTARLRPRFAAWTPLFGLDDETAARRIHEDGVHILLDLSGHTAHNRLPVFAWKPAPVQVSWLGYWATTGVAEMDWFLADETGVPPEHQQHFTENIWYLPETRLCFTPPDTEEPVAPLPARQRGYVCFGSFQMLAKINDEVLRAWSRILASCPGSRLRVQEKTLSDPDIAEALRKRMEAHGIVPERVDLHGAMPRREYLAAHAEVDILLDTFPFTGGTTTCEALWMGVPTLTLAGETLIARQGASLMTAAGLPEWIANDEDEYVAKAAAFASDLEALAGLRAGLREQVLASPLFDAPRFARNLEDALWGMWEERNKIQGKAGRPNPESQAPEEQAQRAQSGLSANRNNGKAPGTS